MIVGRTNALRVEGMDDALRRAEAMKKAGADMLFLWGRKPEEMRFIAERLPAPLMTFAPPDGFSTFPISKAELAKMGYRLAASSGTAFAAMVKAVRQSYECLAQDTMDPFLGPGGAEKEMKAAHKVTGLDRLLEIERRTMKGAVARAALSRPRGRICRHEPGIAGLDPAAHIDDIAPAEQRLKGRPMNATAAPQGRRIIWLNVLTVFSAAILIGAEVFGGAFAAGWAFANLFHLEGYARAHPARRVLPLRRRRHGALRHERAPRRAFHRGLTASAPELSALASADLPFPKISLRLAHYILCSRGSRAIKSVDSRAQIYYFDACPISHVPVAVCRSVGSRTRGRPAAWGVRALQDI